MHIYSINPANDETLKVFDAWGEPQVDEILEAVSKAAPEWAGMPIAERTEALRRLAGVLRERRDEMARLISLEMGKLIGEAVGEVEKCAVCCDYYADNAAQFLTPETIPTDAGNSYVVHQPLGILLAIMPWNFPFWQVVRAAAPAMAAGNVVVLKHASNVPQCAMAIEELFSAAGFPANSFRTLMIPGSGVAPVIADRRVGAVTLTGSEAVGRLVAQSAGHNLKKCVLELGGSDPFIVLDDAELDSCVKTAVASRYMNAGQSCIAAKRFIVQDSIADRFVERFKVAAEALQGGDPLNSSTTLAPMARADLREELHEQVAGSIEGGAVVVTGCEVPEGTGAWYPPSIIDRVLPGMRAWDEELFGPVAIVIRVRDDAKALKVANGSNYGLGGAVWTEDLGRGERMALGLECGGAFVNGLVKSDPRLPFGGVKDSGYGRELSHHGIVEFVNTKSVWVR